MNMKTAILTTFVIVFLVLIGLIVKSISKPNDTNVDENN